MGSPARDAVFFWASFAPGARGRARSGARSGAVLRGVKLSGIKW